MFNKLRGKSPSGHSKKDSIDNTSQHDDKPSIPPPAYTASSSTAPTTTTPFQTRFASLSLHMEDRLRFLRFPSPIISLCRTSILSTWPPGIQEERPYANSHEMKMGGYPWRGYGKEALNARRLMRGLLSTLYAEGWVLCINTDISKTPTDKDTLLFRHQTPTPAPREWAVVAFSRIDRLRLIDFSHTSTSESLITTLTVRLGKEWIDKQAEYAPGVWEFKLNGYPWQASGKDTIRVKELLMVLVETLEEAGWSVYASIDQKSVEGECDTWFCCREVGWARGMGVYQR